ncbi:thioredoxin family protein [Empedobacter sp. GD03797]|uniref:thioredoxin family protein n=1 Tax=Empedobacter sp. GD03797 TaxID=2975382 RepID=UPI0024492083|nr:thioredoxin family protein [Empedobacter sp. GD03797]MDH1881411.1 thioredoxin family protein [Empedobacter sp. GD03797]
MNLTEYINKGLSYEDYITRVEDDLENEIENDDPKEYVQYYALGLQRMNRIFKTFSLNPAQETRVKSTSNNLKLLIITEGWCGDASQILPVVEKLTNALQVSTHYVLRDENLELMEKYKTNGAASIPIIIGVNEENEEAFRFGPRPQAGMEMLARFKSNPDTYSADDFHEDLQKYYNNNKGEDIVNEILDLIDENIGN